MHPTGTLHEKTIGEIVAENYHTSDIFRKHGIDFCCGGKVSLHQICEKKKIEEKQLIAELEEVTGEKPDRNHDYKEWDMAFLSDYIVQCHHAYVKEEIPVIYQYARKVASVHGGHHPETLKVLELLTDVANELTAHMEKEEKILFPYIKELSIALKKNDRVMPPPFRSVQNPIHMMEMEHEQVGEWLHQIDRLTTGYDAPDDACNTFRVLYAKLKDFEEDLHLHIHLENNILFPKAAETEKTLIPYSANNHSA